MLTIEQKENRKNGLGGTDCATILGLNPYQTPYELWMIKTGRMEEPAILTEERLRLRHAHEETIAREYAVRHNVKLRRVNSTIYHKRLPFMFCHLDRVVIRQKKIVECKSSSGFMRPMWGNSGTDEAPSHYMLQVQHQMACTDFEESDIAALIDIDDYREYPQPRNNKIIAKIEEECTRFWIEHIEKDNAPAPSTRGDLKLMYPANNGNFIQATSEIIQLIDSVGSIKESIKSIENEKERVEKEIIQFIADNDGITFEEKVLVTFMADKNGTRRLNIKKRGI